MEQLEKTEPGEEEAPVAQKLETLPHEAAEALRWVAWDEAWHAVLEISSKGSRQILTEDDQDADIEKVKIPERFLKHGIQGSMAQKYASKWQQACMVAGHVELTKKEVTANLMNAAKSMAQHCAGHRVAPKNPKSAEESWREFTKCWEDLEETGLFQESLLHEMKWLLWNAGWHAANTVSQHQDQPEDDDEDDKGEDDDDDEDEDLEEEKSRYGGNYPGSQDDPVQDLKQYLRHFYNIHRGNAEGNFSWRGLCMPVGAKEDDVRKAADAGFNAVRLAVAKPQASNQDPLGHTSSLLDTCAIAGLMVVLDFSSWSASGSGGLEGLRAALAKVISAAAACDGVCGVVLPRVPLPMASGMLQAVRQNGLGADRCAAVLILDESVLPILCEGEHGVLMTDGHVVLETVRRPENANGPQELLDDISIAGEEIDDQLPLGCVRFGLSIPKSIVKKCKKLGDVFREEVVARHEASASEGTHGWFVLLDDMSYDSCLNRKWSWPDPNADRVLWPHGQQHQATLIYLHGFMDEGGSYLGCPTYFYRELTVPSDDEDGVYVPFPGLKVVLPTAALLPITCCDGKKERAWYDYLEDNEGKAEDALDDETLGQSTSRIHALLDREARLVGAQRVFLGGASQGCGTALHAAMTYPTGFGGVIATQGHLLSCTEVPHDWAFRETPVRIFHGLADETIPWDPLAKETYDRLIETGADVKVTTDEGIDHCDSEQEGKWVRSFLAELLTKITESVNGTN